jgi:hypothetical protein
VKAAKSRPFLSCVKVPVDVLHMLPLLKKLDKFQNQKERIGGRPVLEQLI